MENSLWEQLRCPVLPLMDPEFVVNDGPFLVGVAEGRSKLRNLNPILTDAIFNKAIDLCQTIRFRIFWNEVELRERCADVAIAQSKSPDFKTIGTVAD